MQCNFYNSFPRLFLRMCVLIFQAKESIRCVFDVRRHRDIGWVQCNHMSQWKAARTLLSFAVITMVAETEGSPDNTGEIIVLFKKNDIILARLLPGHEMLDLSLCMEEWRHGIQVYCGKNSHVCRIENNTPRAMFLGTGRWQASCGVPSSHLWPQEKGQVTWSFATHLRNHLADSFSRYTYMASGTFCLSLHWAVKNEVVASREG